MDNDISRKALYKTFSDKKFLFVAIVFMVSFLVDIIDLKAMMTSMSIANLITQVLDALNPEALGELTLSGWFFNLPAVLLTKVFMIPSALLGISAIIIYTGAKGEKDKTFVNGAKTLQAYSLVSVICCVLFVAILLCLAIFSIGLFWGIEIDNAFMIGVVAFLWVFLVFVPFCGVVVMVVGVFYYCAFFRMSREMVKVIKNEDNKFKTRKFFSVLLWILGIATIASTGFSSWSGLINACEGVAYILFAITLSDYTKNYKKAEQEKQEVDVFDL